MATQPVTFTKREASVVLDTLVHLSAYTLDEMRDHLGWNAADARAWQSALAKVDRVVAANGAASGAAR